MSSFCLENNTFFTADFGVDGILGDFRQGVFKFILFGDNFRLLLLLGVLLRKNVHSISSIGSANEMSDILEMSALVGVFG